jgi:LysM repeat protein
MAKYINVMVGLLVLLLVLTGCFRQAGPDLDQPSAPTIPPTMLPSTGAPAQATLPGSATPFVTPFNPGEGPDITEMPTLAGPTPTVPLVEPGVTNQAPAESTAVDEGILPAESPVPTATGTIPFAAGPTFTPVPGAPPVNLNPNSPPTATSDSADAGITGQTADSQGGSAPAADDECTYIVQAGDTAFYIATLNGVTLVELIEYNQLENADYLFEGQELAIPNCGESAVPPAQDQAPGPTAVIQPPASTPTDFAPQVDAEGNTIHIVQAGENLFRIALRYDVSMESIAVANGLGSVEAILSVGQQLVIPSE